MIPWFVLFLHDAAAEISPCRDWQCVLTTRSNSIGVRGFRLSGRCASRMTLQRGYLSKSGSSLSVQKCTAICSKPFISVNGGKLQGGHGGDLPKICHERGVHSVTRADSAAPRLPSLSERSQLEGTPSNNMHSPLHRSAWQSRRSVNADAGCRMLDAIRSRSRSRGCFSPSMRRCPRNR